MLVPLTARNLNNYPSHCHRCPVPLLLESSQIFLNRLLISVVAVVVAWLLALVLGEAFQTLLFGLGLIGLLLAVGPVLWASLRNGEYRKYKYSGFSWSSAVLLQKN